MYRGYIKSWRKVLDSDMYRDLTASQRDVFWAVLHLAGHKENQWIWNGESFVTSPGQFVTSLSSIRDRCAKDTSTQNVRLALIKLEKWQFLTNKSTKSGRLISIINWGIYQQDELPINKDANKESTKNQQRINKESTTNKNDKNDKNDKNEEYHTVYGCPDTSGPGPIEEQENRGCPHNKIIALYHEKLTVLPKVKVWSDKNKSALRMRWKEDKERQSLEWWSEFFLYVSLSDFLTGKTKATFVPDLQWLITKGNFEKILNGRYENRGGSVRQKKHSGIEAWLKTKQQQGG